MEDEKSTADLLIEILLDPSAEEGEWSDAGMDLSSYDGERVIHALLTFAADENSDSFYQSICAESLGEIWERNGTFNKEIYDSLTYVSRWEIRIPGVREDKRTYFVSEKPLLDTAHLDDLDIPEKADILLLFNKEEEIRKRCDAAIALGESENPLAEEALIRNALTEEKNPQELQEACGKAIETVWTRKKFFSKGIYNHLAYPTRRMISIPTLKKNTKEPQ